MQAPENYFLYLNAPASPLEIDRVKSFLKAVRRVHSTNVPCLRKFSVSEEDELVRDFEFENDTYINPVKQLEHEQELEYEEIEW